MTVSPRERASEGSQTLERGLSVLLQLSRHPGGLTTSQVATACGLHRSIANRLLVSLHRTGFAVRDPDGRFTIGPTADDLSRGTGPRLRDVAGPILHRLASTVDATVCLVEVMGGVAVTTVVAEPPTDGPRFSYRLGNRDPLDRGAGGLAALASGPNTAHEDPRVTETRRRGYVTTHAELNPGAHGIAAPLPGWPVLAAVNIVTSERALCATAVEPLRRAAEEIGAPRIS